MAQETAHVAEGVRARRYGGFGNLMPSSGLPVRLRNAVQESSDGLDVDQGGLPRVRGWLRTPRILGLVFLPAGFVIGIPEKHEISHGAYVDEGSFNIPGQRAVWKSGGPAAGSGQRMHASGSSATHSTGRRVHHP